MTCELMQNHPAWRRTGSVKGESLYMVHKPCWFRSWFCLLSTVLYELGSMSLRPLPAHPIILGWKCLVFELGSRTIAFHQNLWRWILNLTASQDELWLLYSCVLLHCGRHRRSILAIHTTQALFLFWIVVWKLYRVTCVLYHGEEIWKTCNFLYPLIRFMTQTVSTV